MTYLLGYVRSLLMRRCCVEVDERCLELEVICMKIEINLFTSIHVHIIIRGVRWRHQRMEWRFITYRLVFKNMHYVHAPFLTSLAYTV